MAYFTSVLFKDSTNFDAFGRLKTAEPHPLFDDMSEYGNNPYLWENSTAISGTATQMVNQNAVRLSTNTTVSGSSVYRQTKQYIRYQPGRSQNIEMTFVMSSGTANAVTRIGYYDNNNGLFLERDGTDVNFVRRSFVTGGVSGVAVAQASWNVDVMDGTGPSGKTIDFTKSQILFIQFQYLGVGRVQMGFVIDGLPYVCHEFLNANNLRNVYMSTGSLPLRAEVVNKNTAGDNIYLDMICVSVSSGGEGIAKFPFSASNGVTAISTSTSLVPLLSIRAGTLKGGTGGGGSITNRGLIVPVNFGVVGLSQIQEIQLIYNPILSGTSWQPVNTESFADYDVSATTLYGGTVIERNYVIASAQTRDDVKDVFEHILPLVYTSLTSFQDILTIAIRTVTGNGSAYGYINWYELR